METFFFFFWNLNPILISGKNELQMSGKSEILPTLVILI